MLVTNGMGANGILVTAGFGYNSYLDVVVIVVPREPEPSPGAGGGNLTYASPQQRTARVRANLTRKQIIEQLVQEDEELIAIIISATETLLCDL